MGDRTMKATTTPTEYVDAFEAYLGAWQDMCDECPEEPASGFEVYELCPSGALASVET